MLARLGPQSSSAVKRRLFKFSRHRTRPQLGDRDSLSNTTQMDEPAMNFVCPPIERQLVHVASGHEAVTPEMAAIGVAKYSARSAERLMPSAADVRGASLPVPVQFAALVCTFFNARFQRSRHLVAESMRCLLNMTNNRTLDPGCVTDASTCAFATTLKAFTDADSDCQREQVASDAADGGFMTCASALELRLVAASCVPSNSSSHEADLHRMLVDLTSGTLFGRPFAIPALEMVLRNAPVAIARKAFDHTVAAWGELDPSNRLADHRHLVAGPATAYPLLYSLLWNPRFTVDDTFPVAHALLLRILDSLRWEHVAHPDTRASSRDSVNYVTAILTRLGRVYGSKCRAIEVFEAHSALKEACPALFHHAPPAYWNWLLGCQVDIAASGAHLTRQMDALEQPMSAILLRVWEGALRATADALHHCRGHAERVTVWRLCLKTALLLDQGDLVLRSELLSTPREGTDGDPPLVPLTSVRVLATFELLLGVAEDKPRLLELIDAKNAASQLVRWVRLGLPDLPADHVVPVLTRTCAVLSLLAFERPFGAVDYATNLLRGLAEIQHRQAAALVVRWVNETLEAAGQGLGDVNSISPLHAMAVAAGALPAPMFHWTCGCGASNPSTTTRCTNCLRSERHAAWMCTGCQKSHAKVKNVVRGALQPDEDPEDRAAFAHDTASELVCPCGTDHPWLQALKHDAGGNVLCVTCGHSAGPSTTSGGSSEGADGAAAAVDVAELLAVCSACEVAARRASVDESAAKRATVLNNVRSSKQRACDNCGTELSREDGFCPTCGVLTAVGRYHRIRAWRCGNCERWNSTTVNTCHGAQCRAKRTPRSLTAPANSWTCGCGAVNGPLRLACHVCSEVQGGQRAYTCTHCKETVAVSRLSKRRIDVSELTTSVCVGSAAGNDVSLTVAVPTCPACGTDHPLMPNRLRESLPAVCTACGALDSFGGRRGADAAGHACGLCGAERPTALDLLPAVGVQWSCDMCGSARETGYACSKCHALQPTLALLVASGDVSAPFLWKCQAAVSSENRSSRAKTSSASGTNGAEEDAVNHDDGDDETEPNTVLSVCGRFNPSWRRSCEACASLRRQGDDELRARYLPWSCAECGTRNGPTALLQCVTCGSLRYPPPCPHCGIGHVAMACPSQVDLQNAAQAGAHTRASAEQE